MVYDPDELSSNPSTNREFVDVVAARWSRRQVLRGGLGAAAVGFLAGPTLFDGAARATVASGRAPSRRGLLGFAAVPASIADAIVVPDGYTAEVLIPMGHAAPVERAALA